MLQVKAQVSEQPATILQHETAGQRVLFVNVAGVAGF